MAEEEILQPVAASPKPPDHKRKLDEIGIQSKGKLKKRAHKLNFRESDSKRRRLKQRSDDTAETSDHRKNSDNVLQEVTFVEDFHVEEPSAEGSTAEGAQEEEPQLVLGGERDTLAVKEEQEKADAPVEHQEKGDEQGDGFSSQQDEIPVSQAVTRRMEVPNNKADAGGVASAQVVEAEEFERKVPNFQVDLLIRRMGDTIVGMEAKSGARIQLIPRHPPKGDETKARILRVRGTKEQVDRAKELINKVLNQTVRPSGGFEHQAYRSHGRGGPQWGSQGSRPSQHSLYGYQQRGQYQSHNTQYSPIYGSYPQQMGPGWEQMPRPDMQGMPYVGGGYDYYGGRGGGAPTQHSALGPSPNPTIGGPLSQAYYNYGHPHASDFWHSAPYYNSAPLQPGYGHGYEEPKFDNHAPTQHPFGGREACQPYPQTRAQSGYGQQQQIGKPPAYTIPSQGPPPHSYGAPPIASQPGEAVYQAPTQPYGQNVPSQQSCTYTSSAPAQQPYALYVSAHATDWYNQPPTASTGGYPQQGGHHAPYCQLAPCYAQVASTGYAQHPTAEQGYPEQPASYTGGNGYEGFQDLAYGGGRPAQPATGAAEVEAVVQPGYTQPARATTQENYDQSIPQSGADGKTVSPQPSYTRKEKKTELQGMARHAVRIDQPLEMDSDIWHLAPMNADGTCRLCHTKHHPLKECPPCRICHNEYHKPYHCPEVACDICFKKHRPKLCPYFDSYPKGALLNPGYEVGCPCGNLFDEERWVCTHCGGTCAVIYRRFCFMCNVLFDHAAHECPVHKERAAKLKLLRDEEKELAVREPIMWDDPDSF